MPSLLKTCYRKIRYLTVGRPYVAGESTKAKKRRESEDFFNNFCQGNGLDIGFGGDPLTDKCTGWDWEHGDAQYLKTVEDNSFDFVYSSHTIEHMISPSIALKNWWRVLKPNGHLILYLPHRDLYEKKKTLPSRWNGDHKNFFIIEKDEAPDTIGIVPLINRSLCNFKLIYVKECSYGHTISNPNIHSNGEYSIEVVLKKLN